MLSFPRQVEIHLSDDDLKSSAVPGDDDLGDGSLKDSKRPMFMVTRHGVDQALLQRHRKGCFLQAIQEGSSAANAMLVDGDYLTAIDGKDVTGANAADIKAMLTAGSHQLQVECYAIFYLMTARVVIKLKNDKLYRREYYLNPMATRLHWISQYKSSREANIVTADLLEARTGRNTTSYKRCYDDLNAKNKAKFSNEDRCFSLIFGESEEVQDLCANHQVTANAFVLACRQFIKQYRLAELTSITYKEEQSLRDQWLRDTFKDADANGDKQLSFTEVSNLLQKLNVAIPRDVLKKKFKEADKDRKGTEGYGKLDEKEFAQFYKALLVRPEIGQLMLQYGTAEHQQRPSVDTFDDVTMSTAQLQDFMLNEQGDDMEDAEVTALIETYEPYRSDGQMGIDGFVAMLTSMTNTAFNPKHMAEVYQDMDQPLSHYFIASSHNTYLESDQLYGDSDVEAYIRALRFGCRCVEIDCWDGDDGEPVVYHGHTLTSKILLKDVIEACAKYGFTTSEYPLILSIENHMSVPQQTKLAKYVRASFGDRLAVIPLDTDPMPSPASLKGKVIIKGKRLPPTQDEADMSEDDEAVEALDAAANDKVALKKHSKTHRKLIQRQNKLAQTQPKVKLSKDFSDVVSLAGVKYKGPDTLADAIKTQKTMQMSSFGEKKAVLLAEEEEHTNTFIRRNARQLARTYPDGLRVMSSNYNPQPMFNTGCQIIALNYQTMGEEMSMYLGKFQDNANCGYLLKPKDLRQTDTEFNPNRPHTVPLGSFRLLQVDVISASQLPKPIRNSKKQARGEVIDPYVIVHMSGIPADCAQAQTKVINNNGFNPVWQESMQFNVRYPELATLTFEVYDDDTFNGDDFIATASIPVTSLQQGYRVVHLQSLNNMRIPNAQLFVKISSLDSSCELVEDGSIAIAKTKGRMDPDAAKTGVTQLDADFRSSNHFEFHARRAKLLRGIQDLRKSLGVGANLSIKLVFETFGRRCQEASIDVEATPRGNPNGETLALTPKPSDVEAFNTSAIKDTFLKYDALAALCLNLLIQHKHLLTIETGLLETFEKYTSTAAWEALIAGEIKGRKAEIARRNYETRLFGIREALRVESQTIALVQAVYEAADEVFGSRA
eukprot:TRINITY_DN11963_c0_g1_i1.p1 TRINITY_DN11963_c0_g1~~TRINITY_DN11963_c0_g1_i1.p1  ORF type:complete len:1115 (+),score=324.74 TRINITY_DN11963_c0_g1_i1:98-3442(+)